MSPMRVVIVDDHEVVREGLRWMLGAADDVEVVAEAENAEGAMQVLDSANPDVVLLDVHLPDGSGLDVLRTMRKRFPDIPAIVLSMEDDPTYVEEAVRAGAVGYLVKSVPKQELLRAVRAATSGGAYIQAEVTRPLLTRFAQEVRERGAVPPLTPREVDAVILLADGLATKQIASHLGLSEATVKTYLRALYEKLGAADRAQAVAIALRHRLID